MAEPVDPVNAGNTVRAIGHGHTSQGGAASNELRQVDLPIQSDATMSDPAQYGSSFHGAVMLGAGPLAGGLDTCQGDSGGPLFIPGARPASSATRAGAPVAPSPTSRASTARSTRARCARSSTASSAAPRTTPSPGRPSPARTDWRRQQHRRDGADRRAQHRGQPARHDGLVQLDRSRERADVVQHARRGVRHDAPRLHRQHPRALASVASSDDFNGTRQSKATFTATAGRPTGSPSTATARRTAPFTLQWTQNSPANDDFATPATLTGATGKHYTNTARSTGEPGSRITAAPGRRSGTRGRRPRPGRPCSTRASRTSTPCWRPTPARPSPAHPAGEQRPVHGSDQSRITFPVVAGPCIASRWTASAPPRARPACSGRSTRRPTTIRRGADAGRARRDDGGDDGAGDRGAGRARLPRRRGRRQLGLVPLDADRGRPRRAALDDVTGFATGISVYTGSGLGR